MWPRTGEWRPGINHEDVQPAMKLVGWTVCVPPLTSQIPSTGSSSPKRALRGTSVRELILQGIASELNSDRGRELAYRMKLPLITSKKPGSLKLTNAQINALLFP